MGVFILFVAWIQARSQTSTGVPFVQNVDHFNKIVDLFNKIVDSLNKIVVFNKIMSIFNKMVHLIWEGGSSAPPGYGPGINPPVSATHVS